MKAGKRLAVLVASLAYGGIGKMRVHLVNEFVRQGFEVDLLLGRLDSPYLKNLEPAVNVCNLGTSHALGSVLPLAWYLRRRRPAVLLTQRIRVNVAALRARGIARSRVPVFVTLNTHMSSQLQSLRASKRRTQLRRLRAYYPRNDGLIAISQGVAADAAQLVGCDRRRIHTIANPVITAELDKLASEPLSHPWLGNGRPPVILAAGRLEPQKDFTTLLRAFAAVRANRTCRLLILGEGKQRAALESMANQLQISDDVSLPGFVANPYAYMARARLFVLSSAWEGSSNALAEALAVGTPVVSTDCPSGPAEILQNGRIGQLVPVGDAAALASAIATALESSAPREQLIQSVERFRAGTSAARYLECMGFA